jgi:hypothetical protein
MIFVGGHAVAWDTMVLALRYTNNGGMTDDDKDILVTNVKIRDSFEEQEIHRTLLYELYSSTVLSTVQCTYKALRTVRVRPVFCSYDMYVVD